MNEMIFIKNKQNERNRTRFEQKVAKKRENT